MNRIRSAAVRLATRLPSVAGESAIYRRNAGLSGESTRPITVTFGRERDVVKDAGRSEAWRNEGWDRDVLISVAALTAGGIAEPVSGDRIEVGGEVLEAFMPAGEHAWRYLDSTRTIYRIHCKLAGPA